MNLESTYTTIYPALDLVAQELRALALTFGYSATNEIIEGFFQRPGKFLRPALVFLSAQAVDSELPGLEPSALLQVGVGVELIHNASLVHDDILDEDDERRGQRTVNGSWGNKVALLVGDALYSRAFGVLTRALNNNTEALLRVIGLNELMVSAEVEQARSKNGLTREAYYRIIEGKTARFMSLCCYLGATIALASAKSVTAIESFGLHFGLAYQLFDDATDGDLACAEVDPRLEARSEIEQALAALDGLEPGIGRTSLVNLAKTLAEMHPELSLGRL